jgi:predicted YcjX-like family ATPase
VQREDVVVRERRVDQRAAGVAQQPADSPVAEKLFDHTVWPHAGRCVAEARHEDQRR